MTDKIKTTTRSLTEEMLTLNKTAVDWQIEQSKRTEKQVASLFDASRTGLATMADLQRDTIKAWLNLVAPENAQA